MASNHKLSGVLKGRVLAKTDFENDVCVITFDDGATMKVKIAPRVLANAESAASAPQSAASPSATSLLAAPCANAPQSAASNNANATGANAKKANETHANSTDAQAERAPQTSPRAAVKAVRQSGLELHFDLEDGTTLSLTTREETSCVMLRDKNNVLEYAD